MPAGRKDEPTKPRTERRDGTLFSSQGGRAYPDHLIRRLGTYAPKSITVIGTSTSLSAPMKAFLCSKETPEEVNADPESSDRRCFGSAAPARRKGRGRRRRGDYPAPICFHSAESQKQRLNPRPKTVSRQMPNRDSPHFERLFRLQFQFSRGRCPAQVAENTPQYVERKIV